MSVTHDLLLDELEQENQRLMNKYNSVKSENFDLKNTIEIMTTEIQELLAEFNDLHEKYKVLKSKCKKLEDRDNIHFENFINKYHLQHLKKTPQKSHWNL